MAELNNMPGLPSYPLYGFYDEMYASGKNPRLHYERVHEMFAAMTAQEIQNKQRILHRRMIEEGITFTLFHSAETDAMERTIPFDIIPRVIPREEWETLEKGVIQRVTALNHFIEDVYREQQIIRDGIVPRRLVLANRYFRPEMKGIRIPGSCYICTSGIDIIRHSDGEYYVLEDNLRSPSGFSYLFKGRNLMKELFPRLAFASSIMDVEQSLNWFLSALRSLSPTGASDPMIVLLTPGEYNSAYFEHAYLAQQMGIHLVEGQDLVCKDHKVYMKVMNGYRRVDVIYRRIDDDYLDPLAFEPGSLLGVAGIMNAYRAGNVGLANAPGTGIADDKAMYIYVPDMIRYYLKEEPILKNVPTYLLARPEERQTVLNSLPQMVVKETTLSGGYGMLVGPEATEAQLASYRKNILQHPDRYVAQPAMKLSRAPVFIDGRMEPRHLDLRAYVIMGADRQPRVIPGGLTRVAMKEGSLVVNSSQGGGVKDTWIIS